MNQKYSREINQGHRTSKISNVWRRIRSVSEEARSYVIITENNKKWKLSKDGNFSSKTTWEYIREDHWRPEDFKYIWNSYMPRRISLFMWKLLHQKLPLEDNIKKIGISFASRCACCREHKNETQAHLFHLGDIARTVWKHFQHILGVNVNYMNFSTVLRSWWFRSRKTEQEAIVFHVLPNIICFEIWKGRNRWVFDGVDMDADTIIRNIHAQFSDIFRISNSEKHGIELKMMVKEITKN